MDTADGTDKVPELKRDAEDEKSAEIVANIERYLNNHTREGGHAYQQNMAARPGEWHPLEAAEDDALFRTPRDS
ncbi:MAG TPA: hypothetical protein VF121_11085 [Thermoanaerobaculia bacterium]|nr:hypothetical protein [Thermoanaerobaculia bacterium]